MKRFSIVLFLIIINSTVFSAKSMAAPTNTERNLEQLEEKIIRLEEEFRKEQEDNFYKEDIYQILLENEKDFSGSLYNFTTIFVIVITFFATIAGIILTVLLTRLKRHQDKINLVLDSKEFDDKLAQIEKRLIELRLRERNQYKSTVVSKFNRLAEGTYRHIEEIEEVKTGERKTEEGIDVHKILVENEYEYLRTGVSEIIKSFRRVEKIKLKYEDDFETDVVNPEEELEDFYEELEVFFEDLKNINWHKLFPV